MTATFILSLDCEGKWGVADHLGSQVHRDLTDEKLRAAYGDIVSLLDEFEIPATFAFVGLYSQSPDQFARLRPLVMDLAQHAPGYVGPALADLDSGSREGWYGHQNLETVAGAKQDHEIAFHGSSHVPWTELNAPALERELAIFGSLEGPVSDSKTMVFPRNAVAHTQALPAIGIEGYRTARRASRIANLLSEFIPAQASEAHPEFRSPLDIPAGYFVNWQSGARTLVPAALSRLRAAALLRDGARTNRVVHYWLHPENIASAPPTLGRLRDVLCEVRIKREAGSCEVMTQAGYCRFVRQTNALSDSSGLI